MNEITDREILDGEQDGEKALEGINLPSIIEIKGRFLDMEEMPEKAQVVLALRAFGLSNSFIADQCKISEGMVRKYRKRYDPDDMCNVTAEDRRLITSQMMMSNAVAAMLHITPAKLKDSDANQLAAIASRMSNASEKIRELDKATEDSKKKMKQAMSVLEGDFE